MTSSYTISAFSCSTQKVQPTKRHLVKTTAVIGESVIQNYAGKSTHITELPSDIEAAVRTAIDDQGYLTDTRPDAVIAYIDKYDYVRCDDCHHMPGTNYYKLTHLRQYPDRPPLIEFTGEVKDTEVTAEPPGVIQFRLTNTTDVPLTVFSGVLAPFGLPFAEATDSSSRFLLWPDEFADMVTSDAEDKEEIVLDAKEVHTTIPPDDQLSRTYLVVPSITGFSAGTFKVNYELRYHPREYTRKDPMPPEVVGCQTTFTVS